jgi:hypothetical protein
MADDEFILKAADLDEARLEATAQERTMVIGLRVGGRAYVLMDAEDFLAMAEPTGGAHDEAEFEKLASATSEFTEASNLTDPAHRHLLHQIVDDDWQYVAVCCDLPDRTDDRMPSWINDPPMH